MRKQGIDTILAICIFGLVVFGLIIISSVSVFESYQITSIMVEKGLREEASNDFYLWKHVSRVFFALPLWILSIFIPYTWWRKIALPLFGLSLVLMGVLFLPTIGANYGTATSWINIRGLPSIQPAEFAKLGLILYLAIWMEKKEQEVETMQHGFLPFVILLSTVVVLLAIQPDFGSVLVITTIAASMFFVAGGNILHLMLGGVLASLLAWPIILSKEYIRNRFLAFIDPELDPLNVGFQIKQALIAIGSGGLFGVGFGQSMQKFGYLPEVQGDTVFSAAAEELGFIRISLIVAIYLVIAYRGYQIANHAPDRFSMLVATGITSWLVFQAFINIGVNIAILPLTGITLPFVSYGGSSLVTTLVATGILLNISRYAQENTHFNYRRRVRRTYNAAAYRR